MVKSPQPRDIGSRLSRIETQLATLTGRSPSFPPVPVVLYQKWTPPLQTATSTAYATAAASSAIGMTTLWEGRIEYVSHPCLSVYGVWGDLDSMLPTIRYQITAGVTAFTWQSTGAVTEKHLFDISGLLQQSDVQVALSVKSIGTATGTDRILVSPLGCYQRQAPDDGIFG